MHVDTIGIYFIVGYLVGADLTRLFYWRRRLRERAR
jgi:uncharacterized membrane protein YciS (DUF1049 family)